jgi:CcmD family protein
MKMRRVRSAWRILLVWLAIAAGPAWSLTVAARQPPPQPTKPAQDEFVPIDQLPPGEQLPAAPLLIAAYAVAWLAVAGYLFSIWRRLDRVDRDIAEAGRRLRRT